MAGSANIGKGRKQLKAHEPSKFYQNKAIPTKKIAGEALYQNASLGGNIAGMVPEKPGASTGFSGAPQKRPAHGFGHPVSLKQGPLRMSGHKGAHKIGSLAGASKLKIS